MNLPTLKGLGIYRILNRTKVPYFLIVFLLFLNVQNNVFAEGTPSFAPSPLDEAALYIGAGNTGASGGDYGQFGWLNSPSKLHFNIQSTCETVYLGFSIPKTDRDFGATDVYEDLLFRIVDPSGNPVGCFGSTMFMGSNWQTLNSTNANLLTRPEVDAGPAQLGNAGGYNAFELDLAACGATLTGDYYIEFISTDPTYDPNTPFSGFYIEFFDITVADCSNMGLTGRVWSNNWGIGIKRDGNGSFDRAFNGAFYVCSIEGYVTKLDFNSGTNTRIGQTMDDQRSGFRAGSFNVSFNTTGPNDTGSLESDRQSVPDDNLGNAVLPIFLNEPDEAICPETEFGMYKPKDDLLTGCGDNICVNFAATKPGQIEVTIEGANGNGVYDGPPEIRFIYSVTEADLSPNPEDPAYPYEICILWDGNDANGNPLPLSDITLSANFFQGVYHFPVYDAEFNDDGFLVETIRPALGIQKIYYDDTLLDELSNTNEVKDGTNGCLPPCHRWTGEFVSSMAQEVYGNFNTINTWWFASDDFADYSSNVLTPQEPVCEGYCDANDGIRYSGQFDEASCSCVYTQEPTPNCDDKQCSTIDSYDFTNCECSNEPLPPDFCDDSNCNTLDVFDDLNCECVNTPIPPPDCDDNDCATIDAYDPSICECVYTPDPNLPLDCDDGCDLTEDSYDATTCECINAPIPDICDDNDCNTVDAYDPTTCMCENTPVTPGSCDDGDCNTMDGYDPLTCECVNTPIPPPNCDDGNCNTLDSYDVTTCACVNTPIPPTNCDDNDCTTEDAYDAAICECINTPIPPPDCNDNDCTTNDYYDTTICECINAPLPPLNCDDNDCNTMDVYDATICECVNTPIPPPNCDDNDCTTNDTYDAAICQCVNTPIPPLNCDDNDCNTMDVYDATICECVNTPIPPTNCDDNDCTTADAYDAAICQCVNTPIPPLNCDDGDCNTMDLYDVTTCECVNTPIPPPNCDDNDCTTDDAYDAAICQCVNTPIPPLNCDDNDCNTADVYNTTTCMCENTPINPGSCDDGDCNTMDAYDATICECVNTPIPPPNCDDNDCNTNDFYDSASCTCVNEMIPPPSCDDGDCNTTDTYDSSICECVNTQNPPPNCDDNDCNTNDFYDSATCNCVNEMIPPPNCDDGDCSTIDTYDAVNCICVNSPDPSLPLNCDDGDCATDDSYDEATCSCVHIYNPPNCDDGDDCTTDKFDEETCECIFTEIDGCLDCDDFIIGFSVTNATCDGASDGAIDITVPCINPPMTGANLALGQPATQSSTDQGVASNAVDGNTSGNFYGDNSVTGTGWECEAWWEVDLGSVQNFNTIEIWGRTDANQDFLSNYYVLVSDTPFGTGSLTTLINAPGVSSTFVSGPAAAPETLTSLTSGRYVRVMLTQCARLEIAEVKVLGGMASGDCTFIYNWSDGLPATEDQTGLAPGTYSVTVTDQNGCFHVATILVASLDPPDSCDDDDCNTVDTYDETTCQCVHTAVPPPNCDDGDCSTQDAYDTGNCECVYTPIPPPNCDDGDCNTTDTYDANTCQCVYTPIPPPNCDDGNCNTIDTYDSNTCTCINTVDPNLPLDCDDGDCATDDSYDEATCSCIHVYNPPNCDDGDECTSDKFDEATCECIFTEIDGCGECDDVIIQLDRITPPTCFGYLDGSIEITASCSGGSSTNLALNQPTTQSSAGDGNASNAVDGNTNGNWYQDLSVSGTDWECEAWWEVDLGSVQSFTDIEIWGRTDCCQSFLSNYYVLISSSPMSGNLSSLLADANVANYFVAGPAATPEMLAVNTSGQYVRIMLQDCARLQLAEVKVMNNVVVGDGCMLTYEWSNGLPPTEDQFVVGAGTYTVTVTDQFGCSNTASFEVVEPDELICNILFKFDPVSDNPVDGILAAQGLGGVEPYTYEWSDGTIDPMNTDLEAGVYSVTVTDANGCSCEHSFLVIDTGEPCINVTSGGTIGYDQIFCSTSGNPETLVSLLLPSGGNGAIEYMWMFSTTTMEYPTGPNDPNWTLIEGANGPNYDPGVLTETTYFVRCARAQDCVEFVGETNIVTIVIDPGCGNEGNCIPGGPCDDGDDCTLNDVFDADCNCEGIFVCEKPELVLFPNPVTDQLQVDLGTYFIGKDVKVSVNNLLGKPLILREYKSLSEKVITIDLAKYQNGLYSITVQAQGFEKTGKQFVIAKTY